MQIPCKKAMQRLLRYASTYANPNSCMYLHMQAHASQCKPDASPELHHADALRPEPNHSQCCQMYKKDESRLLEVVGSFPSLHVSVLTCVSVVFRCVAALELVSASCLHICKHDALAYASTMQKAYAATSEICKYICTVLAWLKVKNHTILCTVASPPASRLER